MVNCAKRSLGSVADCPAEAENAVFDGKLVKPRSVVPQVLRFFIKLFLSRALCLFTPGYQRRSDWVVILLYHEVGFKLRWEPDLDDGHRRHADWRARKCVCDRVLLAGAMFDVEVVLSKAFDPLSDLTHWLFEGF